MSVLKIAGCGASAAIASLISIGAAQAAMAPPVRPAMPNVHYVDCAIGFHIGPAGACILGVDNRPPPPPPGAVVVDPPPVVVQGKDPGCETKTLSQTDAAGNNETKTKTNCD
jgi:hypothetical protein